MPQDPIKQDRLRQERLAPLREERRQRLRQAAAVLAWERGYAGISLGMVAIYAGLSRAQASALYARLSDLIADAMATHLRALARQVEDFAAARDLDQPQFRPSVLGQLADMLLQTLADDPNPPTQPAELAAAVIAMAPPVPAPSPAAAETADTAGAADPDRDGRDRRIACTRPAPGASTDDRDAAESAIPPPCLITPYRHLAPISIPDTG